MTSVRMFEKSIVIFESQQELGTEFLNELGGTVVLARRVTDKNVSLNEVPQILANELSKAKKGKVTFSLRTSGVPPKTVRDLYRASKQRLKSAGRPSRYVGTEKKAAQSVVLHENDLIDGKQGCEIVVLRDEEGDLWIGRTVGAQDVNAYTKRDVEKPVRDKSVGLLPPKLAQILLNLGLWATLYQGKAKKPAKKWKLSTVSVFDPFCGTGVIPLECLLRRWDVLASDISQKAVNDCTKNIEWIRKEEGIAKKDANSTVWKHDATKKFEVKQKPDVVVTETTLGPNLHKKPTLKEVQKMCTENEAVQKAFLQNASENLPGVPLVCTFPVWLHSKGKTHLMKIWKVVEELGYEAVLPPETLRYENEQTLLYRRPDQFVGREVVILVPKK